MDEFIMLDLDCGAGTAEAFINGMPAARVSAATNRQFVLPIHEYLLSGRNEVRLVVEPGRTPLDGALSHNFQVPSGYWTRLRVMRMPRGTFPNSPGVTTLVDLNFRPEPDQAVRVPAVFSSEFMLDLWTLRWAWLNARSLPDTDSLRKFALAYVTSFVEAFQNGDPEPYLAAAQPRFEELSAAYGVSVENEYAAFRAQFQRISAEPGFRMHPVTAAESAFRLCAGGGVVDCVDRNWQPLLRSEPRAADGIIRYRLPLRFCFVNEKAWVVR